jgi:regulator of replication initiation timing
MTHDMNAMIQQVHEATRAMELATTHIHELNARLHDLEIENQRLRDRLADKEAELVGQRAILNAVRDRLRRMTEGEL